MERKTCTVRQLVEHFGYTQVVGDEASLERTISIPNTSRPGLELAGFTDHVEAKRIVLIGNKETAYIETVSKEDLDTRFDFITDDRTPMILITSNNKIHPKLIAIAKEKNFPIFTTDQTTTTSIVDVITYLDEVLARMTNVHGVFMNVFGKGVLITGESGMGKSEVALELIQKGHTLIADDRVDISRVKEKLRGTAPEILKGFLEIRGIGIIDVTQMFGGGSYLEESDVDFVIEFEKWNDNSVYMRAGIEDELFYEALDVKVPRLVFPVKEGRNLAVLVESAVRDFMLKQRGINTAKIFDQRVMDFIQQQNEVVEND
jgi:HPr kinase/phosphorylase